MKVLKLQAGLIDIEDGVAHVDVGHMGMHDMQPKLPVGKTLETSVIEKAEVSGVDHRIDAILGSQFFDDSELPLGITDQKKSHQIILGSLIMAYFP